MEHTLPSLAFGLTGATLGALFVTIGGAVSRREITGQGYLPLLFFSVWWYSTGAVFLLQGLMELAGVVWRPDFVLQFTYTIVAIPLICLGLYSLSYYFVHLYIGTNRWWAPLAAYYILAALFMVYLVLYQRPVGLEIESGRANLVFAQELPFVTLQRLVFILLIPPAVGLIAYVFLIRMAPSKVQRFRIVNVAAVIFILFLSAIGIPFVEIRYQIAWTLTLRSLAIVAAIVLTFNMIRPRALKHHLERLMHAWPKPRRNA